MERKFYWFSHAALLGLTGLVAISHRPPEVTPILTPLKPAATQKEQISYSDRLMMTGYILVPINPVTEKDSTRFTQPARILSTPSRELYSLSDSSSQEQKLMTPRIPITYEETQNFIEETVRMTGRRFTSGDLQNALKDTPKLIQCAIRVETPSLNPYAVGKELELGPGQLHRHGKLPAFYLTGYHNPFDPYQVVLFMEDQFAKNQAYHWAGPRDGKC